MRLSRETVEHMAALSRITLGEDEARRMERQLGEIVGYMEILNTLDPAACAPSSRLPQSEDALREDTVAPSADRAELLAVAPVHADGAYLVPGTLE